MSTPAAGAAILAPRRSSRFVAWVRAWRAGLVPFDEVADAVAGTEEHLVADAPGTWTDVPLREALPTLAKLSPDEIRLVLPAPGDPRGLPGPGDFAGAALLAGPAPAPAPAILHFRSPYCGFRQLLPRPKVQDPRRARRAGVVKKRCRSGGVGGEEDADGLVGPAVQLRLGKGHADGEHGLVERDRQDQIVQVLRGEQRVRHP